MDLLRSRDWTQERVVVLWLHPCYVLGTYALLAVGVSIHGPRCARDLVESAPEDEARITAFLEGLQARGVRADRGLLCTVASAGAPPRAVRRQAVLSRALSRKLSVTESDKGLGLSTERSAPVRAAAAEREGFEPPVPVKGTLAFQASPFGHSGTSPIISP